MIFKNFEVIPERGVSAPVYNCLPEYVYIN